LKAIENLVSRMFRWIREKLVPQNNEHEPDLIPFDELSDADKQWFAESWLESEADNR